VYHELRRRLRMCRFFESFRPSSFSVASTTRGTISHTAARLCSFFTRSSIDVSASRAVAGDLLYRLRTAVESHITGVRLFAAVAPMLAPISSRPDHSELH